MFTQACLIRDYNKDLISKIENIGYRNYGNPFQFTDYSILYTTIDGYYVPYKVQVDSSWIDCGTNTELFLAEKPGIYPNSFNFSTNSFVLFLIKHICVNISFLFIRIKF